MKKRISRRLLSRFEKNMPEHLQRRQLQVLMDLEAESFGMPKEKLCKGSAATALRQYADFTRRCMAAGTVDEEKLYQDAYRLGSKIRHMTELKDDEDLKRLIILLYRNIGIRMNIEGKPGSEHTGKFTVSDCYFSRFYFPEECRIMSFVDSGIVSGICGGGRLQFSRRITEGCGFCRACLEEDGCFCSEVRKEDMTMSEKKTAIVIGTGAGGATIAKELQGEYQVTILEEGGRFQPFSYSVDRLARFRKTGVYLDERMIQRLFPNMVIDKNKEMVMVRGKGIGGTTTLATGNAVRYDGALRKLGIDLDAEFEQLYVELPITTDHQKYWNDTTRKMFALFKEMGLDPIVTPKLLDAEKCTGCGHCAIGCPTGAKWDTRSLLEEAVLQGAELVTGCKVTELSIEDGVVTSVHAKTKGGSKEFTADLVVLAAGGLGTPVILEKSGIPCQETLFVDPVLCVAGYIPDIRQDQQLLMPFISQQDGYILSPYMDYLSFFFNREWRKPITGLVSMMIKLADEENGSVSGRKISKALTVRDEERMGRGIAQCREILERLGIPKEEQFPGTLNAGHPGGMLPLTEAERESLHNPLLPENLYVADATILQEAMGNPPILTIMALAKKIAAVIKQKQT